MRAHTGSPSLGRPRGSRFAAGLPLLFILILWLFGPAWLAPVEDFPQGPGGAAAYVSLYRQLQRSGFWRGQEAQVNLSEEEFSGMLSSALLSGRREQDLIRKVRGSLLEGEIAVETVLRFQHPRLPRRYRGPVGLRLRLHPEVTGDGQVQFVIRGATVGRLPVSPRVIRWGRWFLPKGSTRLDLAKPAVLLPLGDLLAAQTGRRLMVKEVSARQGVVSIVVALPN